MDLEQQLIKKNNSRDWFIPIWILKLAYAILLPQPEIKPMLVGAMTGLKQMENTLESEGAVRPVGLKNLLLTTDSITNLLSKIDSYANRMKSIEVSGWKSWKYYIKNSHLKLCYTTSLEVQDRKILHN